MDIGLYVTLGIAVILIIFVVIFYIKTPRSSSNLPLDLDADDKLHLYLKNRFSKSVILTNITLTNGKDSQNITSLLINNNGVFVIDIKGWKGIVNVLGDGKIWQYTPNEDSKTINQNSPIIQNDLKVNLVKQILKLDKAVQGIVVFSENNAPDISYNVLNLSDLENYINIQKKSYFREGDIDSYKQTILKHLVIKQPKKSPKSK